MKTNYSQNLYRALDLLNRVGLDVVAEKCINHLQQADSIEGAECGAWRFILEKIILDFNAQKDNKRFKECAEKLFSFLTNLIPFAYRGLILADVKQYAKSKSINLSIDASELSYLKVSMTAVNKNALKRLNYNNFKRHHYLLFWNAIHGATPGTYDKIIVRITRDCVWPYGDEVTDIHEIKYACKVNGFDYDSLEINDDLTFSLRKGSIEWNNYLAEPGEASKTFFQKQGTEYEKELFKQVFTTKLETQLKEKTGQDVNVIMCEVEE